MPKFTDRLQHAWNAFVGNERHDRYDEYLAFKSSYNPDKIIFNRGNDRTIVAAIENRIALDTADLNFCHVRVDEDDKYQEDVDSQFNYCLTQRSNKDQISQAFFQDIILSMFEEGVVAVVPIDTTLDPYVTGSYDIETMRTGKIVDWGPNIVSIEVYNEKTGNKETIRMPKDMVGIIENPFYAIMNEPNSTLKRLIRKLTLLDVIDEQSGSGKLDIIIQLPYSLKTTSRQLQAKIRKKAIEDQLRNSKYGIAYIDSTEKITQLNRPAENQLLSQIEYLTSMLFSQLGITQEILNGTADENAMNNYYNRICKVVAKAIVKEFETKFLTKTARSRGQRVMFFRNPLELIPVSQIGSVSDSLTRNEIVTSNEIRSSIGMKPSKDPDADQLRNKNLNQPTEKQTNNPVEETEQIVEGENQNG